MTGHKDENSRQIRPRSPDRITFARKCFPVTTLALARNPGVCRGVPMAAYGENLMAAVTRSQRVVDQPDGACELQDSRTNADNCRMAVRRPLLLALAAIAVAAVLFATLNRHHTTPVPPVRVLSTAEARKVLSTLHVPRTFNRSTRCPGATGEPEVCFIRRPPVALTLTGVKRLVTETGLASPGVECLQGHGRYLCFGSAHRDATKMIIGLTSKTSGWTKLNVTSAGKRGVPSGFLDGTSLRVEVVGERIHHP
jgi:hypothetical protein